MGCFRAKGRMLLGEEFLYLHLLRVLLKQHLPETKISIYILMNETCKINIKGVEAKAFEPIGTNF